MNLNAIIIFTNTEVQIFTLLSKSTTSEYDKYFIKVMSADSHLTAGQLNFTIIIFWSINSYSTVTRDHFLAPRNLAK